ncbi:unnamed protein product [Trifolium pratense]|uniref:Uncharacterized protein n=1 Tax=Trifolium pratense TaxID=57577 RepID=A0ACB0JL14_TRIPR|nr:unnamed protein product [Trifolium pratense]
MPTGKFVFKLGELTAEERMDYKKLVEFVEGLPPYVLEDSDGEPLLGEDGKMSSAAAALRQARAAKNKREASSTMTTSSAQQSPTISAADRSKRIRLSGEEDTSSHREQEVVDLDGQDDSSNPGPHRLTPGAPAEDFVLPPIYAHGPLLDGRTKVKINPTDEAILTDIGPEALRSEIATQSMALLKLIEVATFLNGRECKYLAERDDARKALLGVERRLAESEASCERYREEHKTLSSNLKETEDRLKTLSEEKDGIQIEVEGLKAKINELEEKLVCQQASGMIEEEEKEVDPQGDYASSSRAALIAKIQEYESNMVVAASFSFNNAIAQLRILNPNLGEEGLNEEKEVRDGQICSPPPTD